MLGHQANRFVACDGSACRGVSRGLSRAYPVQECGFPRPVGAGDQQVFAINDIETEWREALFHACKPYRYRHPGALGRLCKREGQFIVTRFAHFSRR